MKKFFIKLTIVASIIFGLFTVNNDVIASNGAYDYSGNSETNIDYCPSWECSIQKWQEKAKNWLDWIEKNRWFAQYVQDIVEYTLWFLYLAAVIMIIYAGWVLLMSTWDQIAMDKAKNNIVYVIVWILVIYLANSIVNFLISAIS